jgi:hypothetical protein
MAQHSYEVIELRRDIRLEKKKPHTPEVKLKRPHYKFYIIQLKDSSSLES